MYSVQCTVYRIRSSTVVLPRTDYRAAARPGISQPKASSAAMVDYGEGTGQVWPGCVGALPKVVPVAEGGRRSGTYRR